MPPGPSIANGVRHALDRQKCNVDASFSMFHNKVGISMRVRDANGVMCLLKLHGLHRCGRLRLVKP
jgi:hypothetical protein